MFRVNREKLSNLVHYVCWQCDRLELGSTKLNKVLWYSDVRTYIELGQPITGERYIKRQYGPVSANILSVVRELEGKRAIVVRKREYAGRMKRDYIALLPPVIEMFSPEEISIVDECIHFVCRENTADSISRTSHGPIWKLAEIGEDLPYQAMMVARLAEVTPEDVKWAREFIDKRS